MLLLAKIVSVDVEVPFGVKETGFELNVVESPGTEADPVSGRLQQKPFRLETVIVVLEEEPSWTATLAGVALTEKSNTLTSTVTERVKDPLVPVIVTK